MSIEFTQEDKNEFIQNCLQHYDILVASEYSVAAGHEKYESQHSLIHKKLNTQNSLEKSAVTNDCIEFVSLIEKRRARLKLDIYKHLINRGFSNIRFENFDRTVSSKYPWLSFGLNYFVHYKNCGETKIALVVDQIKPFSARCYRRNNRSKLTIHQKDKIQGNLGLINLDGVTVDQAMFVYCFCDETEPDISWHPFDKEYWDNDLFPSIEDWFMNLYLPQRIREHILNERTNSQSSI